MINESLPLIDVIGSLNIDLTTFTSRIPEGGETLSANSFLTGSGGKGGNQAAACARLSRRQNALHDGRAIIRMIGAIGNDIYGQTLLADLEQSGVDTSGIIKAEAQTGVAVIIVEESTGQNRILLNAGANATLVPSQFSTLASPLPDLIILQLEIPVETTLQIMHTARSAGVKVLLNPAPAVDLPTEAYKGLAHLVLNETEAAILSHRNVAELDDENVLPQVAQDFHDKGVDHVIITLGARGVYFSGDTSHRAGLVRAEKVKVVDTTAAGDTFVGAYALETVTNEFEIERAVRKANRAAAITVVRKGAQQSIPWLNEIA